MITVINEILNGGDDMPICEKEYDGYLFDQLSILERLERVERQADCRPVLEEIEFERRQIERKLYRPNPAESSLKGV